MGPHQILRAIGPKSQLKDDRGFNFGQQMAVLQNQWRLNGAKIVDKTRAISMRKICASCGKPNARTYDLRVVISGSPKKIARNKMVSRSPEQLFYVCFYGAQNNDFSNITH